jgi:2,4-dienoyl-CoA reductase-like NADH-dependent reductase (Old Yellow Enzyme family)
MVTLQDEVMINGMRLRNRVALPPLTTNYGSPQGLVTEEINRFYEERSRDVGLVIVEASAVRADGRIVPGSLGLWEDGHPRRGPLFSRWRGYAGSFTLGICLQA